MPVIYLYRCHTLIDIHTHIGSPSLPAHPYEAKDTYACFPEKRLSNMQNNRSK